MQLCVNLDSYSVNEGFQRATFLSATFHLSCAVKNYTRPTVGIQDRTAIRLTWGYYTYKGLYNGPVDILMQGPCELGL